MKVSVKCSVPDLHDVITYCVLSWDIGKMCMSKSKLKIRKQRKIENQ